MNFTEFCKNGEENRQSPVRCGEDFNGAEKFPPVVVSVYLDVWYTNPNKIQKHSVNSMCNVLSQETLIRFMPIF
jgi:hypothetical protein